MKSVTNYLMDIIEQEEICISNRSIPRKTFYSLNLIQSKEIVTKDYFYTTIDAIEHFLKSEIKKIPQDYRERVRDKLREVRYSKPSKEKPLSIEFDFLPPDKTKISGIEIRISEPKEFVQKIILDLQKKYEPI